MSRSTVIPEYDYDVDGRSDVFSYRPDTRALWAHAIDGPTLPWSARIDMNDSQHNPLKDGEHLQAIGRVDRSGDADIVWKSETGIVKVSFNTSSTRIRLNEGNPVVAEMNVVGVGDVDGDGAGDLLWRNATTGQNAVWLVNRDVAEFDLGLGDRGCVVRHDCVRGYYLPNASPEWTLAAIGDFDADGKMDAAWRNATTGQNAVWLLDGPSLKHGDFLPPVADPDMTIAGSADFSGDGREDLLWRNQVTGENAIWALDGTTLLRGEYLPPLAGRDWQMAATGDFDGDGHADIHWRNSVSGENAVWLMNRWSVARWMSLPRALQPSVVISPR